MGLSSQSGPARNQPNPHRQVCIWAGAIRSTGSSGGGYRDGQERFCQNQNFVTEPDRVLHYIQIY